MRRTPNGVRTPQARLRQCMMVLYKVIHLPLPGMTNKKLDSGNMDSGLRELGRQWNNDCIKVAREHVARHVVKPE